MLTELGFETPTGIQEQAIPQLLEGESDFIGLAQTGTGKTAAFGLPLLEQIDPSNPVTQALVLAPTRELGRQIAEQLATFSKYLSKVNVLAVYGGAAIYTQIKALKRTQHIIIATPGRLIDLIKRKAVKLDQLQFIVLDEADEMLNMGFAEDLDAILQETPKARQTALFSATMPPRIGSIARRHLHDPVEIQIIKEEVKAGTTPRVHQVAYLVARAHKVAALVRILDVTSPKSTLVFCRTRLEVDELTSALNSRGYRAEGLHGGLNQAQRDRVMQSFRSGKTELLVATDVAARGLDISHVSHVINYDVPSSSEANVHRIGRTGRAGRGGEAITLVEPRERWLLQNIVRRTKSTIEMAALPTVADLQAKRLERIEMTIKEVLKTKDFERFRTIVNTLAKKHDPLDIAAAAMQLAEGSKHGEGKEEEIPTVRDGGNERSRGNRRGRSEFVESSGRERSKRGEGRSRGKRDHTVRTTGMVTLRFSAGRALGVGPGDLVGAIANEAKLNSKVLGPIKISEQFSQVKVPEELAKGIIKAFGRTRLKGKKVTVRISQD